MPKRVDFAGGLHSGVCEVSKVLVQNVWLIWFLLAGCLGVIGYAGYKLCYYGDVIAQISGLSRTWVGLVLLATVTSLLLPFVAEALAKAMQWQQSFVGTLFVAAITSAPEVAVTLAALRMGSVDMAIGNLFGSNLFNMVILAVDDLAYLPGPLFSDVSIAHAVSAFSAMMMSGVAVVGLIMRPVSKAFRTVSWISLLLFAIYILNTLFMYLHDH